MLSLRVGLTLYHVTMTDFLDAARALHAEAIVLDGHADTPQRFVDEGWHWSGDLLGDGQLSSETADLGGLHGGFLIAWPEPERWHGRNAERTRSLIESIHGQAARFPNRLALCCTASEVLQARQTGRYAALVGVEGGHAIENSLDRLREFYAMGARYMTLTWFNSTDWCGSSGAGPNSPGLTAFGREVVREMNRLGMLVDVSHISDAAFWDVLDTSTAPVIASHSSSRTLCEAARNLTDDMVRALSAQGGLVMVNFFAAFVSEAWRTGWNALKPEVEAALDRAAAPYRASSSFLPFHEELRIERQFARRLPPAPFSTLVDHFDHLMRVAGSDHVGFGSDFDGIPLAVDGIDSAADLPKITAALLKRGWQAADLRGVLGGNLLRVLQTAEQHARATG